jgi:hypothetical protein
MRPAMGVEFLAAARAARLLLRVSPARPGRGPGFGFSSHLTVPGADPAGPGRHRRDTAPFEPSAGEEAEEEVRPDAFAGGGMNTVPPGGEQAGAQGTRGTGLDLSIPGRVAPRLGCTLEVASTVGVGSPLRLTLPPRAPRG